MGRTRTGGRANDNVVCSPNPNKKTKGFGGRTRTGGRANDNVVCSPNPNKKTKGFMGRTRTGGRANDNVVCSPNPNKKQKSSTDGRGQAGELTTMSFARHPKTKSQRFQGRTRKGRRPNVRRFNNAHLLLIALW